MKRTLYGLYVECRLTIAHRRAHDILLQCFEEFSKRKLLSNKMDIVNVR